MKLPAFLGGASRDEEQEAPKPGNTVLVPDGVPTKTTAQKIEFHIDRFTRALEQCEKGPEREAELQGHLNYWLARRDLEVSREGMN